MAHLGRILEGMNFMFIVVAKRPLLRKKKHGIDIDNSPPSERGTVTQQSQTAEVSVYKTQNYSVSTYHCQNCFQNFKKLINKKVININVRVTYDNLGRCSRPRQRRSLTVLPGARCLFSYLLRYVL